MKPALLFSCLLSLFVVAAGGCGPSSTAPEPEVQRRPESFRAKFGALRRSRNLDAADELVVQQMMRTPDDPEILLLAARLSVEREDWTQADERFEALAAASGELGDDRWEEWMVAKTAGGDVMNVIERLQAMPEKSDARWRLLGRLLSIVGDVWGAQSVDRRMVDRGIATPEELTSLLCLIKPRDSSDAVVDAALRRYPDDLRPRLAEVVRLWLSREKVEASRLNEQIVAEHPDYGPAVGLLAYLYADTLQLESLGELIAKQDPASLDRPEFWYALGLYRQQAGRTEAAVASLLQSAADPFVAMIASGRLATGLGGLGLTEAAEVVAENTARYQELCAASTALRADRQPSQRVAVGVAELLAELGREKEVQLWLNLAAKLPTDPVADFADQKRRIGRAAARIEREALIADLSERFRPEPSGATTGTPAAEGDPTDQPEFAGQPDWDSLQPIRLVDEAAERGLEFSYDHGQPDQSLGRWLHHITGGGVAVEDYDLDGWPDVFFTQAGGHPDDDPAVQAASTRDQLFFNRGGHFQRVDDEKIPSFGYGQGVAAGDVNGDGFADLFIANIGANRLLINRGDGSFRDATEQAGMTTRSWTSSVAIADMNDDGLSDLIEINYTEMPDSIKLPCYDDEGELTACMPLAFGPALDHVWISRGDGTFVDEGIWNAPARLGRGLGILIGDLDGSGELEAFVANDQSDNHLWQPAGDQWQDAATVRGLAVGADGRPQGCMGIAWGDPDFDDDLDLMVTNYLYENNNFYVQQSSGYFIDRVIASGLHRISHPLLGFGILMEDFDQDGFEDVFVANGLVNKNQVEGLPFRQPAQVLRISANRFRDDPRIEGTYLETPHVGRAVARADFDRDGRVDLVVGHLGEPAALLINRSPPGRRIGFDLIATATDRDAVGAKIRVRTDRRTRLLQRVAGYGYYATYDPTLTATLEPGETIEAVRIDWPSGETQTLPPLDINRTWQITQGSDRVVALP